MRIFLTRLTDRLLTLLARLQDSGSCRPTEKVLSKSVGHVDDLHDAALRFVLASQEVDLVRQVVFDRARDALVKELRLRRAVEVAIKIGSVAGDVYVVFRRRPPVDEVHQRA